MNNVIKLLSNKNYEDLDIELTKILREQFNLRMQMKSGQFNQFHLFKKVRRNIACIKTYLYNTKYCIKQ